MLVYLIAPIDTYWAGRNSALMDLARIQSELAKEGVFATCSALAAGYSGILDSSFSLLEKSDRVLVVPLQGWETSPLVATETNVARDFRKRIDVFDEVRTGEIVLG